MATLKIKYVHSYRDRHGKLRFYFRKGSVQEALPGIPGSRAFSDAYDTLLVKYCPKPRVQTKDKFERGSLGWVIEQYRTSDQFKVTEPSTKVVYIRHLDWLTSRFGEVEFTSIEEDDVRKVRNLLKDKPSVADRTVDKIGMLWRFAKEHLELTLGPDPSREVASIHKHHEPHKAWPPELCSAFEGLPNQKLLLAYHLMRYTGQRRSDIVKMKWSQFDGTAIEVVQQKTGAYAWVPAHKVLRSVLAGVARENEFILTSSWGGPYKATSITNQVCTACSELGYPGYSPHGLRHLAGAALAEAGCSTHEIMSILGHEKEAQALVYVKQAQKKVMARNAVQKWEQNENKSG